MCGIRFGSTQIVVALPIKRLPDVKLTITHAISGETTIAKFIQEAAIGILDHELVADSPSISESFC